MSSDSPGTSQNASAPSAPDFSSLPRGLLGRKGIPVARGARLPSLRTPRDLTLGGATKRTFTPNITARREKRDDDFKSASGGGASSERGRGRGRGERGRGRGRGNNLIQLAGSVFGEGIASEAGKKKGAFGQSTREGASSGSKSSVPVPKYIPNSKGQTKAEKEEEEATLNELLKDDFVDDWDDEDGNRLIPVQLPLLVKDTKPEAKEENEEQDNIVKIKPKRKPAKLDDLSDEEGEAMDVDVKIKPEELNDIPEAKVEAPPRPISSAQLFSTTNNSETGKLLFLQFPDCLPGISGKSDEDIRIKREPGPKGAEAPPVPQPEENKNCVLSDLPEGFIGKLQVLRSGRTRLLLGPVCLNVEMGTPLGFLQDLVSVRVNEDRDPASGDMFVLGQVQEKLVCIPDMDSLLKNLELK